MNLCRSGDPEFFVDCSLYLYHLSVKQPNQYLPNHELCRFVLHNSKSEKFIVTFDCCVF